MFVANFKAFEDGVTDEIRAAGPVVTDPATTGLELAGPGEG